MLNLPAHIAPPVILNALQLPPHLFSVMGLFQFSIPSGVCVCHLGVTHLLFLSAHVFDVTVFTSVLISAVRSVSFLMLEVCFCVSPPTLPVVSLPYWSFQRINFYLFSCFCLVYSFQLLSLLISSFCCHVSDFLSWVSGVFRFGVSVLIVRAFNVATFSLIVVCCVPWGFDLNSFPFYPFSGSFSFYFFNWRGLF